MLGRLQTGPSERRPACVEDFERAQIGVDRLGALDMEHRGQRAGLAARSISAALRHIRTPPSEARSMRKSPAIMAIAACCASVSARPAGSGTS